MATGAPKELSAPCGGVDSERGEVMLAIGLAERNEVAGGDVEDELCRMSPGVLDQCGCCHAGLACERGIADVGLPACEFGADGIVEDGAGVRVGGLSVPGCGGDACEQRGDGAARQHVSCPFCEGCGLDVWWIILCKFRDGGN